MPLHPVLADKLRIAVGPTAPTSRTLRDARLPAVPGKVHSVIGMRRAGKTTFLHQLQGERRATLPPERAIYVGFDDDNVPAGFALPARAGGTMPGVFTLNIATRDLP